MGLLMGPEQISRGPSKLNYSMIQRLLEVSVSGLGAAAPAPSLQLPCCPPAAPAHAGPGTMPLGGRLSVPRG